MEEDKSCPGIRYLSCQDIELINEAVIKFTPKEQCGVMSRHSLESLQQSPNLYRYYEQCEDIFTLAAVLFIKINKAHAFHNGNKRTAFIASVIFLRANGFIFEPSLESVMDVSIKVAINEPDYDNPHLLSSWFKAFCREVEGMELNEVEDGIQQSSSQLSLLKSLD
ncbi:type II toxin-antitoxin system death-on-curing family toxin [Lacimicrobium alkaliphilum]|uniref:type II toxin-antitoxin system death-on-curing family toxin n=1 Tax=Lacimicrobium alkaliphilum TaxID=1526571 RepID=UPI000BFEFA80